MPHARRNLIAEPLPAARVEGYGERVPLIVDRCRGKRVLDVGIVSNTYDAHGRRVHFDVSPIYVAIRGVAAHAIGLDPSTEEMPTLMARYPEYDLRLGSIEHLANVLPTCEQLDAVVMGDVLEHLSNPGLALDAIAAWLRPKGELIITCPNAYGGPNWMRFLCGRYRESPTHVTAHSKLTLANLLDRHGYSLRALWTCLDRAPRGFGGRLLYGAGRRILRRWPDVGGTLFVVASPDAG
jgi:SAM-dependent methyltransferase